MPLLFRLHGQYANIVTGHVSDALRAITRCGVHAYNLRSYDSSWATKKFSEALTRDMVFGCTISVRF